jgi:gamma-glutamyltranspeptidase/glutathione hydrolase
MKMLARGGNAVDAVLATAITLTVVEPCSNGIGSDLFAILWDGRELVGLNASGRAPAGWSRERFAGQKQMPQRGWDSVTIPGAVAAWVALSTRYGKLPFADLFEPAIRYARDGYAVSPVVAEKWRLAEAIMPKGFGWQEHFLIDGHTPKAGERFASRAMAATLEQIAATLGEAFYRGALADAMVRHAHAHGSAHTHEDFERHAIDWVTPLALEYRGVAVHEIPPNGQGIAALMALGMLRSFDLRELPPDSIASAHLQIEAMKLAFADAHRHVGDLSKMKVTPDALLDDAYLAERARAIDPKRAQTFEPGNPPRGGTVYACAADASGIMVSLIQSNYMGFGSGVVVPGTGISLQNRGAGFSLEPGHPNELAGGKRPFHTQWSAACDVRRDGRTHSATGSRADRRAHDRLRDESAGGARCATLEGERRPVDRSRVNRIIRIARGPDRTRPSTGIRPRFIHGLRCGPGDRANGHRLRRRVRSSPGRPGGRVLSERKRTRYIPLALSADNGNNSGRSIRRRPGSTSTSGSVARIVDRLRRASSW